MKCILCNTEIDTDIVRWEEKVSGEPFNEGYCSDQCKQTDEMISRADCED